MVKRRCSAISLPWSQVSVRRSWLSKAVNCSARTRRTSGAPLPAQRWTIAGGREVLPKTGVETPRYTGAAYSASGWFHVGTSRERKRYDKPKNDIWLRPLRRNWMQILNRRNERDITPRLNGYCARRSPGEEDAMT